MLLISYLGSMRSSNRQFYGFIWMTSFLGLTRQEVFQPPLVIKPERANDVYFRETTNNTLDLRCQAEGKPPPTYEWRFNGEIIKNTPFLQVDPTTGLLRIREATRREQGVYECRASNVMDGRRVVGLSYPQTVWKLAAEPFKQSAEPIRVKGNEYGSASLRCLDQGRIVARKDDIFRKWYMGKGQLLDDPRRYVSTDGTLHFIYLKRSDELNDEKYRCAVVINSYNIIVLGSDTILTVQQAPPIAIKPALLFSNSGLQVILRTTAKLECVFSGYDPSTTDNLPMIKWYDDADQEIKDGQQGNKYTLTERNRILAIADVGEYEERTYFCQATNSAGTSDKERVNLNVTSAPLWVSAPRSVTKTQNSDVVIHCSARSLTGEMAPNTPVWTINGQPYHSSRERNLVLSDDFKTLTVRDVRKPDDILCVQCSVDNSVGRTIGSACINVISFGGARGRGGQWVTVPIEIVVECQKCKYPSPRDCNCTRWELALGDSMRFHVSTTSDPAYRGNLTTEWLFHDQAYRYPKLPPHMTISVDTGDYVLNTSGLAKKAFSRLGGDYLLRVTDGVDSKNITFTVTLKGVEPEPTKASSAGFDMWIIGLIIGIVFLLIIIIIIIVALVCRKKQEGVYNLGKKETTAGLDPEKDLENRTFSDLSRPEYEEDMEFHDEDLRQTAADDGTRDRLLQRNAGGGSVSEV